MVTVLPDVVLCVVAVVVLKDVVLPDVCVVGVLVVPVSRQSAHCALLLFD